MKQTHKSPEYVCNEPNGSDIIDGYKLLMKRQNVEFEPCEFMANDVLYSASVTARIEKAENETIHYPTVKISKMYGN